MLSIKSHDLDLPTSALNRYSSFYHRRPIGFSLEDHLQEETVESNWSTHKLKKYLQSEIASDNQLNAS